MLSVVVLYLIIPRDEGIFKPRLSNKQRREKTSVIEWYLRRNTYFLKKNKKESRNRANNSFHAMQFSWMLCKNICTGILDCSASI